MVGQTGVLTRENLVGDVHFMTGRSVFATVGQSPWWIVTALMALGCVIRRKRPQAARKDAS